MKRIASLLIVVLVISVISPVFAANRILRQAGDRNEGLAGRSGSISQSDKNRTQSTINNSGSQTVMTYLPSPPPSPFSSYPTSCTCNPSGDDEGKIYQANKVYHKTQVNPQSKNSYTAHASSSDSSD
jgi:hypothetical protein